MNWFPKCENEKGTAYNISGEVYFQEKESG